jgi:beta-glucosidase
MRARVVAAVVAGGTIVVVACSSTPRGGERLPYQDPQLAVDERVDDLLARMTLEEKCAQLRCSISEPEGTDLVKPEGIGGLGLFSRSLDAAAAAEKANRVQKLVQEKTRLGIPVIVHDEALHGLMGTGATSFPQAIALAATFDPDLVLEISHAIGKEVRSRGIHQALSPVVNLARDVRWGRTEETYGEDPWLSARIGVAFCRGLEGERVITTPKHFAVNVGEGGRDSNAIDVSERLLREGEFVPFEACFKEAGSRSVMAAYSSLNGRPCSANRWLLGDVLRREWGFPGFVVSDYGSVSGILEAHHVVATKEDCAAEALEAGLDMELPDVDVYGQPLVDAVKHGRVAEKTLDAAVRRVLATKFRAGLFEDRVVDPKRAAALADCPEHRALALRAAREALVLLRNEGDVLPLRRDQGSIAVVGPLADVARLGGYSGDGTKRVTILEGIRAHVSPSTEVVHAKGCDLKGELPSIPTEFLEPEGGEPGAHGLRGEYFGNKTLDGSPVFVRTDPKIDFDWGISAPGDGMPADFFSVRWTGKLTVPETRVFDLTATTEDGVRLWIDGRKLVDSWVNRGRTTDRASVRLEAGVPHDLRVEYYQNRGTASASLGWDWHPGGGDAMTQEAVAAATRCDATIVVVGIDEGEGRDRSILDLPEAEEKLIAALAETRKPLAVVLVGGSAITMTHWMRDAGAILETWYVGEEGGTAIADVLFGDANPAGRLPITFPRTVGQVPLHSDPRPTGRGWDYTDAPGTPAFPFGFGLSYTTFRYGEISVSPPTISPSGRATVSIEVRNTGTRAGDEVVQLYVHDEVASVVRPVQELRGFRRVSLGPGESKRVTFTLGPAELSFWNADMRRVVEPGTFALRVGSSSSDVRATATLTVN